MGAEISWIYPPRFPKMKNDIKIKTYIKCIHRPAYAYDRPHLLPSSYTISSHLRSSLCIYLCFPSFPIIYFHLSLCAFICYSSAFDLLSFRIICPNLPPSVLICLHSSSSHLICLHLRSFVIFISHHLPLFAVICINLPLFLFI